MNKFSLYFLVFIAGSALAANIAVPAGGDLQSALNQAAPGDTITLTAGATYTGNFTAAPNPGSACITIESSAVSSLPTAGNRVSSAQSALMPKIVTPNESAALTFSTGANNYCVIGIEVHPATGVYVNDLIRVGTAYEISVADLPQNITFDRVYVHGDPAVGSKRGIALNGGKTVVENSYISSLTSTWQDTQALAGWNGPGPYQIINNYLEAGTEIVSFGGAVPTIPNNIPSNIVIQKNYFYKPLSWFPSDPSYAGVPVWVKNDIELKFGQHVTIDSNIFENNWVGADQRGFMFMFSVRTENGAVPWAVINDVKVTNNLIRHSAAGVEMTGSDDSLLGLGSGGQFLIENNLWEDISSNWGGDGRWSEILLGVQGATIDHNTILQTGYLAAFDLGPSYNINFQNNLAQNGWGFAGDGVAPGLATLLAFDIGGSFVGNVVIGGTASLFPAGNFFPASLSDVDFVSAGAANYALAANSPFKNAATDGTDIGATVKVVTANVASVVSGQSSVASQSVLSQNSSCN